MLFLTIFYKITYQTQNCLLSSIHLNLKIMKILKNSEEEVFYKSYLDTEINCIRTTWIGYVNLNNVKAGCLAGLDLIKETNCPYLINDNTDLVGPWQQANEWIETV